MWVVSALLFIVWLVLYFIFHKSGSVHILLLTGISILVIQVMAYRKAKYHRGSEKQ